MANICYPLLKNVPEKLVEKATVGAGQTLTAGQVVLVETLKSGSKEVYDVEQVTDVTAQKPAIIVHQRFVEDAQGKRVNAASVDLTEDIQFTEGMTIYVIRLDENLKFEISTDVLDNTGVTAPAAGVFLIPQDDEWALATSDTLGTAIIGLKVEATASIPVGGNLGIGFADSVIARVVLA